MAALGIAILWHDTMHPALHNSLPNAEETDRLLIILDCSKSMDLRDAGPNGDQNRGERAADLIRDLILGENRIPPRTTLLVFAERSIPLFVDSNDWRVIQHGLNNRSLSEVLFDGKLTTIGAVLENVFDDFVAEWPDQSAVLMLVTDGDSEDSVEGIKLPRSIRRTLVVGIGSAEGRIIGDFRSRQDERTLGAIARELGGAYINANAEPIPVGALNRPPPSAAELAGEESMAADPIGPRSLWALWLMALGIPLLLAATLIPPFLDPSTTKPIKYETQSFIS